MKKLLLLTLLGVSINVLARKVTVTSTSDHLTAPTSGMLRCKVDNALTGDTILFSVLTVSLLGEIEIFEISGKSITIDGGVNKVTIDAGQVNRCFDVSAYSANSNITLKNLKMIEGLNGNAQITVYDVNGIAVLNDRTMGPLDLSSLHDGLYFIKAETASGMSQAKVMVKR